MSRRQRQAFEQRHDVDAARFQHRAVGETDLVQLQPVELFGDPVIGAGQEGGAHAPGLVAEPEIEAGRLDLVGIEARGDFSAPDWNSAEMS